MKIFDWLKGKFSRDKPQNFYRYSGFPFFFGSTPSGKVVNEFTAMQMSAVYACVRILAESIASLPLHVYEYKDGGKVKALEHPLYFLLHDAPNEEMTSFVFRETSVAHLLLRGNCYAQIMRDKKWRVIGLYPLRPNRMSVNRDNDGNLYYLYLPESDNPRFKNRGQVRLESYDVLHVHGLGYDGLIGYSPIAMAKNTIGISIACEEFGASFFANGARLGGVLEHPGIIKDPARLRESWQDSYGGSANAGKIAILDAQFLETRKFQIAEIARIFRVPLHMLNELERSTFSNITQQSLEFVTYSLMPWLVRWEQALNKSLFTQSERKQYFVKFNVDGLLRGDYETRMKGHQIAIQNGIMSVNDIRELEDLNPIADSEGGNLHIVNGNVAKLAQAGKAYEK